ncbi:MAG: HAMP domain-containing sensor histidine kinase [Chloroflexota bacterium]
MNRAALPWLGAVIGLAVAIASGVLLAQLLMSPPLSELAKLALYFAVAGGATLGAAWVLLLAIDRTISLSIQTKALITGVAVGVVALLNVLIIAQLMFVSTDHDFKMLLAVIAFSVIATVVLSVWVARSVAGRLHSIAVVVDSLASGDLSRRTHVSGRDEVASLAADVNALAMRLQEAEQQRQALDREKRDLTTAISHDLRTPIASLRAMVEALEDKVVAGPEVDRYYSAMGRDLNRLSRMIDSLFELAQIDAGSLALRRSTVVVEDVVREAVDALRPQAKVRGVALEFRGASKTSANLDGDRIERAIANLVRNAIEHTPADGRVEVGVSPNNGWIEVNVADTGEGIDADDLPRIWERFYRADKSRTRDDSGNGDGAGLGLAIVRGIVEAHGGTVAAQSQLGIGSTFSVRINRD